MINYDAVFTFLLNLSIQLIMLVALSYAMLLIFRVRNSVTRYGIWLSALIGFVVLLLLGITRPLPNLFPLHGSSLQLGKDRFNRIDYDFSTYFGVNDKSSKTSAKTQSNPKPSENLAGNRVDAKHGFTFSLYIILVMIWLLGVIWKLGRFVIGCYFMIRLRKRSTDIHDAHAKELFKEITKDMGIKRHISLESSAEIQIPVSMGLLKPAVIMPNSIMNELSDEEMRMIFIHELAHIKRLDFIVKIIQSLLNVLFFFHPVFYLLKTRLIKEMEFLCDDWVIHITGKRCEYARCLLNICADNSSLSFSNAILGHGKNLKRRLEMLLDERRNLMISMPINSIVLLITFTCVFILFTAMIQPVSSNDKLITKETRLVADKLSNDEIPTLVKNGTVVSFDKQNKIFVAYRGDKWFVVVEGKEGKEYDMIGSDTPVVSTDGKKVVYTASIGNKWFVIINGIEEKESYDDLVNPVFSQDCKRLAYVAQRDNRWFVILDSVKGREYDEIRTPLVFSQDGKRFAYAARLGKKWFVVLDGVEGKEYEAISSDLVFNPNNNQIFYTVKHGSKMFCVTGEIESKEYDWVGFPVFSQDGKRIAYLADHNKKGLVVIDGIEGNEYDRISMHPIFSPDNKRIAYMANRGDEQYVVVDGVEGKGYDATNESILRFSPDSNRMAYWASDSGKWFIVVDEVEGKRYDGYGPVAFSPDSKHLAYMAKRGNKMIAVLSGQIYWIKRGDKMVPLLGNEVESEEFDGNPIGGILGFDNPSAFSAPIDRSGEAFQVDVKIVEE